MNKRYTFAELTDIIATLRGENGCAWDRAQTHESLKKCLIDECQEVIDAIDKKDDENLCEELGDVLLQVVINARIAEEEGRFTIEDVITGLCEKMIRRHPHVFGGVKRPTTPEESLALWQEVKRREKMDREARERKDFLDKQEGSVYK